MIENDNLKLPAIFRLVFPHGERRKTLDDLLEDERSLRRILNAVNSSTQLLETQLSLFTTIPRAKVPPLALLDFDVVRPYVYPDATDEDTLAAITYFLEISPDSYCLPEGALEELAVFIHNNYKSLKPFPDFTQDQELSVLYNEVNKILARWLETIGNRNDISIDNKLIQDSRCVRLLVDLLNNTRCSQSKQKLKPQLVDKCFALLEAETRREEASTGRSRSRRESDQEVFNNRRDAKNLARVIVSYEQFLMNDAPGVEVLISRTKRVHRVGNYIRDHFPTIEGYRVVLDPTDFLLLNLSTAGCSRDEAEAMVMEGVSSMNSLRMALHRRLSWLSSGRKTHIYSQLDSNAPTIASAFKAAVFRDPTNAMQVARIVEDFRRYSEFRMLQVDYRNSADSFIKDSDIRISFLKAMSSVFHAVQERLPVNYVASRSSHMEYDEFEIRDENELFKEAVCVVTKYKNGQNDWSLRWQAEGDLEAFFRVVARLFPVAAKAQPGIAYEVSMNSVVHPVDRVSDIWSEGLIFRCSSGDFGLRLVDIAKLQHSFLSLTTGRVTGMILSKMKLAGTVHHSELIPTIREIRLCYESIDIVFELQSTTSFFRCAYVHGSGVVPDSVLDLVDCLGPTIVFKESLQKCLEESVFAAVEEVESA